jgi:hypothetical protein
VVGTSEEVEKRSKLAWNEDGSAELCTRRRALTNTGESRSYVRTPAFVRILKFQYHTMLL